MTLLAFVAFTCCNHIFHFKYAPLRYAAISYVYSNGFLHPLPHLLHCRGLWGRSMCLWTRGTPGTWPSCPQLVTSSSTPFWQPMMKWSSCMLTSQEVSWHRNHNHFSSSTCDDINTSKRHRSSFPGKSLCVCVFCVVLQIQDSALFTCQMIVAPCTPSHWNTTFTPPRGVKPTSLTLPPCAAFSPPASWQKVSDCIYFAVETW